MLYICPMSQGLVKDTLEYGIWSEDWKKMHRIDLDKETLQTVCKKKKKVTLVNWMQVLAQSDEDTGTGQYATKTITLEELNNKG